MAYVDERSVADAMKVLLGGTGLTFRVVPAEDESVDAEVEVLLHGQPTDFSVQVGGGYTALNEYLYVGDTRATRQMVAMKSHGHYGVQRDDMRALAGKMQQVLLPARASS